MADDGLENTPQLRTADASGFVERRNALREEINARFVRECDRHLVDMDVEDGPKSFRFPYIDEVSGKVRFADGILEQEKITIDGHSYEIEAPLLIKLTSIEFHGGYDGMTHMEGSMFGLIPSPVATKVKTADLYKYLNTLRRGMSAGTSQNIPTTYGKVKFTAL